MTSTIIHIIQYCCYYKYCTTVYCYKNSIILTKHGYSHDRVGTCSSSTDPSRRPREPSKASSWKLRYVQPPRRVRGGALEAPRSLLEDTLREGFAEPSRRLREGFAKAPRAPSIENDSSDDDKPPPNYYCFRLCRTVSPVPFNYITDKNCLFALLYADKSTFLFFTPQLAHLRLEPTA